MIQQNELRIGNWVKGENDTATKIAYVTKNVIGVENEIGGVTKYQNDPIFSRDIITLTPIPLTPEILEKCGFKLDYNLAGYVLPVEDKYTTWRLWFLDGIIRIIVFCDFYSNVDFMPPCQSLHQLQNLYFALTGKELEVNL